MIKQCDGLCGDDVYHTHHLTLLGKFHFSWRYKIVQWIVPDTRPQPPISEIFGAPWIDEYKIQWREVYKGYEPQSCYVRDEKGFWVWVTNTPMFDREWFDSNGWQFPAVWITSPSQEFYRVGRDALSTIVSLPDQS